MVGLQVGHNNTQVTTQTILKYSSRNAHIWRRQMVWLHFAEALNAAGYPRFAYQILARGLSNSVIRNYVLPYYTADSTWIQKFEFDDSDIYSGYHAMTVNNYTNGSTNMMGIHERGSGWAYLSKYYQMPDDTLITDSLQRIAYQQDKVGEMIADECALEFAFEGLRYYDLMRMAIQPHLCPSRQGQCRRDEVPDQEGPLSAPQLVSTVEGQDRLLIAPHTARNKRQRALSPEPRCALAFF